MRPIVANYFASSIALLLLVGMVTSVVALTQAEEHFWVYEVIGCLITIPLAFAMWTGAIWRNGDKPIKGPSSWKEWILLSLAAAGLSGVFLVIDIYITQGHPGISAIFTVGAIAMCVVAIPSALRAWLLERLYSQGSAGNSDA